MHSELEDHKTFLNLLKTGDELEIRQTADQLFLKYRRSGLPAKFWPPSVSEYFSHFFNPPAKTGRPDKTHQKEIIFEDTEALIKSRKVLKLSTQDVFNEIAEKYNLSPEYISKLYYQYLSCNKSRDIKIKSFIPKKFLFCPQCYAKKVVKNGTYQNKQRYLCKNCQYNFTRVRPRGPYSETLLLIHKYNASGKSLREIASELAVSHTTVARYLNMDSPHNLKPKISTLDKDGW